ncbi:hypothetical protein N8390_05850 [Amylibacter sp.]|nr:hypothetical protein [Amylibacter sp.]
MVDGRQTFAITGQALDVIDHSLGILTQRYLAFVWDGIIEKLFVEPDQTAVSISGANSMSKST